jgi:adenylyltransferase/sulfurtransferase
MSGKLLLYNGLNTTFQTISFQVNESEKEKGIQNGLAILNQISIKETGTITADEFFREIAIQENLVIDIRENYEEPKLAFGNIKLVPLSALEIFLENSNHNQKIILFCQIGDRSKLAATYLIKKGFTRVFHLQNGIEALAKTSI